MEMSLAQARTLLNKEDAIEVMEETLMHVYGLCIHVDLDSGVIPPAARDCRRCVAEHIADALSRKAGVVWEL
jgi:hypothetical protein